MGVDEQPRYREQMGLLCLRSRVCLQYSRNQRHGMAYEGGSGGVAVCCL